VFVEVVEFDEEEEFVEFEPIAVHLPGFAGEKFV
jgi:hypothetical protein